MQRFTYQTCAFTKIPGSKRRYVLPSTPSPPPIARLSALLSLTVHPLVRSHGHVRAVALRVAAALRGVTLPLADSYRSRAAPRLSCPWQVTKRRSRPAPITRGTQQPIARHVGCWPGGRRYMVLRAARTRADKVCARHVSPVHGSCTKGRLLLKTRNSKQSSSLDAAKGVSKGASVRLMMPATGGGGG